MKNLDDRELALVGRMNIEHLARMQEIEGRLEESEKARKAAEDLLASLSLEAISQLMSSRSSLIKGSAIEDLTFTPNGMVMVSCVGSHAAQFFKLQIALKKQ
jgi:hypothetical protein